MSSASLNFRENEGSAARYAFVTSPPKCFWSGEKPLKPLIMWNDGRFCRHFWYMTALFAATFGIWRHFLPSWFPTFCEWRRFLPSLFWIWRHFLTAFGKNAVAFCRHISIFSIKKAAAEFYTATFLIFKISFLYLLIFLINFLCIYTWDNLNTPKIVLLSVPLY